MSFFGYKSSCNTQSNCSSLLHIIIEIPIISNEITHSLSRNDIVNCAQVCSIWHAVFSPILWRRLSLVRQDIVSTFQTSVATQQGLLRNSDAIRSIHSEFCYVFDTLCLPSNQMFCNLVSLDSLASELHNKGIVDHTNTKNLVQFINLNTSLQEIILRNFPLASVPTSILLANTLQTHPGLKRASITCYRDADLASIRHVVHGAALGDSLIKLSLVCSAMVVWDPPVKHDSLGKTMTMGPGLSDDPLPSGYVSRLRQLTLDARLGASFASTLLPILEHCHHLQHLYIPDVDLDKYIFPTLCSILQSACPSLRHITAGYQSEQDEMQASLFGACTSGLSSWIQTNHQQIGPLATRVLVTHPHMATIEHLDLVHSKSMASKDIVLLLTSCPHLRVFKAMNTQDRLDQDDNRFHICDLPVIPSVGNFGVGVGPPAWICRELEELHIGFKGFRALREEGVSLGPYVSHIYDQLAVLTKIQQLYLGSEFVPEPARPASSWSPLALMESVLARTESKSTTGDKILFDLSLEGGLAKLASLERLQKFSLSRMRNHRLGPKEVMWIGQNWPRLSVLYGAVGPSRMDSHEYVAQLLKVRPQLTVSMLV